MKSCSVVTMVSGREALRGGFVPGWLTGGLGASAIGDRPRRQGTNQMH